MLTGEQDLKDSANENDLDVIIKDTAISYTKTNKLITALYMVTDIMDKDEPLRNKLRTLGTQIISDMHSTPTNACGKVHQIMSFLDIASAINIISEMNTNILRKEFLTLNKAIKESTNTVEPITRQVNLSELFQEEYISQPERLVSSSRAGIGHIGHQRSTRIGVQKGSTLMKALSDKTSYLSNTKYSYIENFDLLKKQRRDNIMNIIKIIGQSSTIKDIKDKIKEIPEQAGLLVSCSEKTLQRELMSMIKDGVLDKTGEKRWSRYVIKN